jgi:hypothetical protein
VLDYKGAILGGFIAYGLPGLMWLSLRRKSGPNKRGWHRLSVQEGAMADTSRATHDHNDINTTANDDDNSCADEDHEAAARVPLSPNSSSSVDEYDSHGATIRMSEGYAADSSGGGAEGGVETRGIGLSAWSPQSLARVTLLSYVFLCFAVVTGVMGTVVTTVKLMDAEYR